MNLIAFRAGVAWDEAQKHLKLRHKGAAQPRQGCLQIRRQPTLQFFGRLAAPPRQVLQLVVVNLAGTDISNNLMMSANVGS